MNHLQYLDLLLESIIGKWATVKNVPIGQYKFYRGDDLDLPVSFAAHMKKTIGKRLFLAPSQLYDGLWRDAETDFYYHPDWLDFHKEGDPISLFPETKMRFKTFIESESTVYYHGGPAGIKTFEPRYRGIIYFTKDETYARAAAERNSNKKNPKIKIYKVKLNLKKTAKYTDPDVMSILLKAFPDYTEDDIIAAFDEGYDPYELFETPEVIAELKAKGYDSVKFEEEGQESVGVFYPEQITII